MDPLRNQTIRLAFTNPEVRPYLLPILASQSLVAFQFSSPSALKSYLKEHPKADKSKHTVVKPKSKPTEHKPGLIKSLKETFRHVLFDDFTEVKQEASKNLSKLVTKAKATKWKKVSKDIQTELSEGSDAVKSFFGNRRYRRRKMKALGASLKKGAKAAAATIWKSVKHEAHELKDGAKAFKQVLTPGSAPLDKKQKKSLYSLATYAAGAAIAAAGGGVLLAGASTGKSFAAHVAVKSVSHLLDSFFVHGEATHLGYEVGHHALHHAPHAVETAASVATTALKALSHIASVRTAADDEDKEDKFGEGLLTAILEAVSNVLDGDMTDDEVTAMISGDDYGVLADGDDGGLLEKIQAESKATMKSDKSDKSDKEAALRGRLIRLAHSRPDLRSQLLPIIAE